ncbi:hypothetical protein FB446DRAFT_771099 [Lentinula raphanica]|nr:hypothetical protein FB446DRAFT_771099 [Lentinula raphanica]
MNPLETRPSFGGDSRLQAPILSKEAEDVVEAPEEANLDRQHHLLKYWQWLELRLSLLLQERKLLTDTCTDGNPPVVTITLRMTVVLLSCNKQYLRTSVKNGNDLLQVRVFFGMESKVSASQAFASECAMENVGNDDSPSSRRGGHPGPTVKSWNRDSAEIRKDSLEQWKIVQSDYEYEGAYVTSRLNLVDYGGENKSVDFSGRDVSPSVIGQPSELLERQVGSRPEDIRPSLPVHERTREEG